MNATTIPTTPAARARLRPLAAALAATLALSFGAIAHAHGGMGMHPGMGPMGGPGMAMPGGPGGLPMGGRMLDRWLDDVGATAEQRTQIRAIADAAAADLRAHHEAGMALRDEARRLFAQPTIDAAAAEAQRQKTMQHLDQASKRQLQAMLDVAAVLTPEQRARWSERMGQRRETMERHRHERRPTEGGPRS